MGANDKPIVKKGPVELVGINEQVDQAEYGGAVSLALSSEGHSGEILNVTLVSTEEDAGSVQTPAGILYIFNADPSISPGDTAMAAASRLLEVGQVSIAAADWKADANGASVTKAAAISFELLTALWFAWYHEDATSLNDGGTDDERLQLSSIRYLRHR
jgi:hypothetical protein